MTRPQSSKAKLTVFQATWPSRLLLPISDVLSNTMLGSAWRWFVVNMGVAQQLPSHLRCLVAGHTRALRTCGDPPVQAELMTSCAAMLSMPSLNKCPTSIRRGPRANTTHLLRTETETRSAPHPLAYLGKRKSRRNTDGTGLTSPLVSIEEGRSHPPPCVTQAGGKVPKCFD